MNLAGITFMYGPPSLITRARNGAEIWQAGYPERGNLRAAGVDLLVLCAEELCPRGVAPGLHRASTGWTDKSDLERAVRITGTDTRDPFPGVDVFVAPNRDEDLLPLPRFGIACDAAKAVVDAVKAGRSVLVTCAAGRNRSGLVTAMALMKLFGRSGEDAVLYVRRKRPQALFNETFAEVIRRL